MRSFLLVLLALSAAAMLAACGPDTSGLTGKDWQLSAITSKTPAFQGVVPAADQARYAITFATDGTFAATADCNAVAGTYTTSGSNGMTISVGPSTLVACPEGSYGSLFAHALGSVSTWAIADGQLTLSTSSGGTMTFGIGPEVAPTTEPTPAPSATATATPTPTPTPTPAPTPTPPPGSDLPGTSWQLTTITERNPAFQGVVPPADRSRYTLAFAADGTFSATADCNQVNGTYVAGTGGTLTITPGPSTIVACPEGSLGDLYVLGLSNAQSYVIAGNALTITLVDGGTLVFERP